MFKQFVYWISRPSEWFVSATEKVRKEMEKVRRENKRLEEDNAYFRYTIYEAMVRANDEEIKSRMDTIHLLHGIFRHTTSALEDHHKEKLKILKDYSEVLIHTWINDYCRILNVSFGEARCRLFEKYSDKDLYPGMYLYMMKCATRYISENEPSKENAYKFAELSRKMNEFDHPTELRYLLPGEKEYIERLFRWKTFPVPPPTRNEIEEIVRKWNDGIRKEVVIPDDEGGANIAFHPAKEGGGVA